MEPGTHLEVQDSRKQALTPSTHHRNDSSYSNSYSLLDIYGIDSPGNTQDEDADRHSLSNSISLEGTGPLNDAFAYMGSHANPLSDTVKQLELIAHGPPPDVSGASDYMEIQSSSNNAMSPTSTTSNGTPSAQVTSTPKHILLSSTKQEASVPDSKHKSSSPKNIHGSTRALSTSNATLRLDIPMKRTNYIESLTPETIEKLLESPYDRYGFKKASSHHDISKQEYNDWFSDYSEFAIRRKQKWLALMKSNGLGLESDASDAIPSRFPPKSDKVKKMVRRGIPAEWRGSAWFFYAGGNEKLNKHVGVYEQIVRDTKGIHNKDTEVIERDLNRTFPDNIYFNDAISSSEETSETYMITALRRVLTAFAHYQPQIGYCQSLNFLAGLLLLFMDEERAFWMLVILTERIIPKVHSATLEGVHTDQGVLMLCIKEYIPQLWAILGKTFEGEKLSEDKILSTLPPVTLVTSSWFMSLFVGNLPIETVLRVWDIVWYEGSKTIFRISLTICRMCLDNPEFQNARNNGGGAERDQIELFQFMQNFPKIILDPNFLIDNCFKKIGGYGYGSLSQDEINKCREFVSKQRAKLDHKKNSVISAELTDEERKSLVTAQSENYIDQDIHDVYGFHRPIMSGMVWNKNISNKMKKKFARKPSRG